LFKTTSGSLDQLNPEQRAAVEHVEGPALVLAGAGSGKTRVLTTRVAHLILEHGVPAHRVLAVTFTNKAAGEMRDRIGTILGRDPRGMWIGTFHALGARLLRRHAPLLGWTNAFTIFDAEQSLRQVKRTLEGLQIDTKKWNPKAVRASAGAPAHIQIHRADWETVSSWLQAEGIPILVADASGVDVRRAEMAPTWAMVLGSEGSGVRPGIRAEAAQHLAIPMTPGVDSLNVAMAGSILLFSLSPTPTDRETH
jgi:tRNA(Leu) C34 or U34 (ribose-2'-O)-methylase TrmL